MSSSKGHKQKLSEHEYIHIDTLTLQPHPPPTDSQGNIKQLPDIPDSESINVQYEISPDYDSSDMIAPGLDDMKSKEQTVDIYSPCIKCMDIVMSQTPYALKESLDKSISYETKAGANIVLVECSSCAIEDNQTSSNRTESLYKNVEMSIPMLMEMSIYDGIINRYDTYPHAIGSGGGVAFISAKDIYNGLSKNSNIRRIKVTESKKIIMKRMVAGFF